MDGVDVSDLEIERQAVGMLQSGPCVQSKCSAPVFREEDGLSWLFSDYLETDMVLIPPPSRLQ